MKALDDEDSGVCESAKVALERLALPEAISSIKTFVSERDRPLLSTISKIQECCNFYNYEITQSDPLPAVRQELGAGNRGQITNVYHIKQIGNLNTGNVTIYGNQIGDTSNG